MNRPTHDDQPQAALQVPGQKDPELTLVERAGVGEYVEDVAFGHHLRDRLLQGDRGDAAIFPGALAQARVPSTSMIRAALAG